MYLDSTLPYKVADMSLAEWGRKEIQPLIDAQLKLRELAGKEKMPFTPHQDDPVLVARVQELAREAGIEEALRVPEKLARKDARKAVKDKVMEALLNDPAWAESEALKEVGEIIGDLEKKIVRARIVNEGVRIDGRDTRTVRPIEIRQGVLPRTHGSALFTRGETQALVTTTLGTKQDEQIIDGLCEEQHDRFMLHYNMPPFATGETGRVGSPKRREIGHGRLAKRALKAVLPSPEEFQYTLRVVSEICESNGCLSMLDAGVPLKDYVAGVAMGLIKEGNRFAVLTDILGDEDHLGDMDFKVAGTENGVTALQMDIKIEGITPEIMQAALAQAHDGRQHILSRMHEMAGGGAKELSDFAPRMISFKINPEKIRDVIGKGGSVIRALTEETGTTINVEDDGMVTISSPDMARVAEARRRIEEITAEVEAGQIYEGTVTRLLDFGAIVQLLPGKDGLLHISQIANERVNAVSDYLKEGQKVRVKVIEADEKGRVRLSMKALLREEGENK